MILTCPECATRYFVDDAKLGGAGKAVRCAACGARWTARAEADVELELSSSPELGAVAHDVAPGAREAAQPFPKTLPKAYRAKVQEKSALRRAVVHGIVWAGMAGVLAAALVASVVFRVEVVRLVPRAASAYAMAGLRVNSIGLTFENVSARPALQDGHAALVVSGGIRNIEGQTITAPSLRINVLNKVGARVASLVVPVEDARIAPGQTHNFVIPVLDPPPTAEDVEVAFELGHTRLPAPHAAAKPAPAPKVAFSPPLLRPADDEAPEQAVLLPASTSPAP